MSSWLTSPLGVLVAHAFGVAQQPIVMMLVLGTGACTAFQMLLNECLAAGHARETFVATKSQHALVLAAQMATCAGTLLALPSHLFTPASTAVLCALLAMNSALSYQCAMIYFRLVMHGKIGARQAVTVGALPGIASLVIYASFSLASHALPALPLTLLLSVAIVPSLVQWSYLRLLSPAGSIGLSARETKPRPIFLIGALVALTVLSVAITALRDSIAAAQAAYAALIVVALNSLASVTNTLTRASFLASGARDFRRVTLLVGLGSGLLGVAVWPFAQVPAKLLVLLGVQIAIIAVIEAARRLPTTSSFKK